MNLTDINYLVDVTVSFSESSYSVDENDGVIELTLILSNPSSTDINVHMMDNIGSATSKPANISFRKTFIGAV